MINRFFKPPSESFFLFGPRGTGKSTLMKSLFANALWIDLLSDKNFRKYSARPELLGQVLEGLPPHPTVVIDEIQRIPLLLNEVHRWIEKNPAIRFVLTGSSARKLKRESANLLGGRALFYTLHPFLAGELGAAFSLERALQHGTLPLIQMAKEPEKKLEAYVGLYLREEVQREGLVRNLGAFSRFLEVVSFSHGQVLNCSRIAEDVEVKRSAVSGYLSILDDLLLSFKVPVFTKRAKRDLIAHPKFYYFDAGVFRILRPQGPLDGSTEMEGQALEGLVAQHLLAWNAYGHHKNTLYFWRTRWGLEVDFVVYGPQCLWAFEVKNTTQIRSDDVAGLRAFREDYPETKTALLYRGDQRLLIHGIPCLPCEPFLKSLHPENTLDQIIPARPT